MSKYPAITWHNYVMLTAALSFLVGCRFATNIAAGAWLWLLLVIGVILLFVLVKLERSYYIAIALCALCLGIMHTHQALTPIVPQAGKYEISGYVYGDANIKDDGRITFTLADLSLDGNMQKGRAYCSVYVNGEMPMLFDGAAINFDGRVYLPDGKSGEPHFDFRIWMLQNNTSFGIASSNEISITNTPETAPYKDWASRLRHVFSDALTATMGDHSRMAMAMLFSDRDGLAEDENEAFRTLGIAHVLSVSGLHVGLIGGLFVLLLKKRRLAPKLQPPLIALFLAFYCALTGFSAASVRAAIMFFLYTTASALLLTPDPLAILSIAMLLVLILNPLQAHSIGFIMSFSAVASIVLLVPVFLRIISNKRKPPKTPPSDALWMRIKIFLFGPPKTRGTTLATSLAAQIGVLIPTATAFHSLPLYGVLINLFIVPYMGILLPVYLFTLVLSPVPFIGAAAGSVASLMSDWLLWAIKLLAMLPYASIRVPSIPPVSIFGAMLVILIVSRRTYAPFLHKLCAIVLICAVAITGTLATMPEPLRYIQLAVEQADAALLIDHDQTIAIDVGDDGRAVSDYLLDEGRDLDALYITHLHLDHALGIHELIASGIKIKQIYLPTKAAQQGLSEESLALHAELQNLGIPITELAAGDQLRYNDTVIDVLWPNASTTRTGHDANDMPLVMSLTFGGYTILCTSDLSGIYEPYATKPCDVLKVAHHGSAKSTFDTFLDYANPQVAMITCTSGSQSLPAPSTLERLSNHAIPVLRTDVDGDITITIKDGQLRVTPYKVRKSD